jgi:hypothetical protein
MKQVVKREMENINTGTMYTSYQISEKVIPYTQHINAVVKNSKLGINKAISAQERMV